MMRNLTFLLAAITIFAGCSVKPGFRSESPFQNKVKAIQIDTSTGNLIETKFDDGSVLRESTNYLTRGDSVKTGRILGYDRILDLVAILCKKEDEYSALIDQNLNYDEIKRKICLPNVLFICKWSGTHCWGHYHDRSNVGRLMINFNENKNIERVTLPDGTVEDKPAFQLNRDVLFGTIVGAMHIERVAIEQKSADGRKNIEQQILITGSLEDLE